MIDVNNDRKNRTKSFPHLESQIRGVLEALYTFLVVKRGKGIGESNQGLRKREETLLRIPNILRLLGTYSILLLASASTMNNKYTTGIPKGGAKPAVPCVAFCCVVSLRLPVLGSA